MINAHVGSRGSLKTDGGVKMDNIREIVESDVENLVTGSVILRSPDTGGYYRQVICVTRNESDAIPVRRQAA